MSALAIREATADDHAAIDALLAGAFPSRQEADLVRALRANGDLALELVAEAFGDVVGHAAFPRLVSDAELRAAALAPLAVAASARERGVGAALVQQGLAALADRGVEWCLVLGDPAYYGRFGFSAEAAAGFATPYDGPYQQTVGLVLQGPPPRGALTYPAAFTALG